MSVDSEKEFEEKEHRIFPSMALKSNSCQSVNERLRTAMSCMPKAELTYDVTSVGSSPFPFDGIYSLTSLCDGAVSRILKHEMEFADQVMITAISVLYLNIFGCHMHNNAKQDVLWLVGRIML
jgi:hypothetical protein